MSGFCRVITDSVILSHGEGSCENKWGHSLNITKSAN